MFSFGQITKALTSALDFLDVIPAPAKTPGCQSASPCRSLIVTRYTSSDTSDDVHSVFSPQPFLHNFQMHKRETRSENQAERDRRLDW